MRYFALHKRILISLTLLVSACAGSSAPVATGGILGAGVGAGTGALVGTALSNGDVAASALLGGAIGLPVGMLLGYQMKKQSDEEKERSKIQQYIRTQEEIRRQEDEIGRMREEQLGDIPANNLPYTRQEDIYTGPTLHNPLRY